MKKMIANKETIRVFFFFLSILFASCQLAMAKDYDGEYTYPTGYFWGISGAISYELSDTRLAELVQRKDRGGTWLRFKQPGDLVVTVHMHQQGYGNYAGRFLIHITGHAVDETAVDRNTFAQEILALVNKERAKVGAKPLHLAEDMQKAARVRAVELTIKYSHTRPNGKECFTVLKKQGCGVGENIAAGANSPAAVMKLWMESPGHRKNILNPLYEELGVGYTYNSNTEFQHYWVQLFRCYTNR